MTMNTTSETPARPTSDEVHGWFGLSYSSYAVLPRTLLQSMPDEWQARFVTLMRELDEAFAHVEQPECYKVAAAVERTCSELSNPELRRAGVTVRDTPGGRDYIQDGDLLDEHEDRVLVPVADPVPDYNRGRTHIPPRT